MAQKEFVVAIFVLQFFALSNGLPTDQPSQGNKTSKIIGGRAAVLGQLPYQAELIIYTSGGVYLCGGTLISPSFVATAAHCVTDPGLSRNGPVLWSGLGVGITVGQIEINYWPPIFASNVLVHSGYSSATHRNDLALLYFSPPITFSSRVSALQLPAQGTVFPSGTTCTLSGWGETSYNGPMSSTLLYTRVRVLGYTQCNQLLGVVQSELCTSTAGADACFGDSGGPVACTDSQDKSYFAGIVSYGSGCASGIPAVNTYVSYLTNLINSAMSNVISNKGQYSGTQFIAIKELRGPAKLVLPYNETSTPAGAQTTNNNSNNRGYGYTTSAAQFSAQLTIYGFVAAIVSILSTLLH